MIGNHITFLSKCHARLQACSLGKGKLYIYVTVVSYACIKCSLRLRPSLPALCERTWDLSVQMQAYRPGDARALCFSHDGDTPHFWAHITKICRVHCPRVSVLSRVHVCFLFIVGQNFDALVAGPSPSKLKAVQSVLY